MPQPPPAAAQAADTSAVVDSHARDGAACGGKCSSMSSSAVQLTPYELEREARVAANRQVLVSLGLDVPPDLLVKPAPAKRGRRSESGEPSAPKPLAAPTRQSKRQRGEAPLLQPLQRPEWGHSGSEEDEEEHEEGGAGAWAAAAQRRRARNVAAEFDAKRLSTMAQEHDDLNGYRYVCVCVCVCVRARVRACVRFFWGGCS